VRYGLEKFGAVPAFTQVDYSHSDTPRTRPVTDALPTQSTRQTFALSVPQPFILGYYTRTNPAVNGVGDPLPTQSAQPRHYLVQPVPFLLSYYGSTTAGRPVTEPVGTVTTVDRHGLVMPDGELRVEDTYFRMLKPNEIGAAMAFPADYVVRGNKRQQVRQLGNAVTPPVMRELIGRCVDSLAG